MTIKLPSQTQIFLWFLRKEYQLVVKYQFWKKELIRSFSNFLFFQYSKSQVNKGKNSCIFVVVAKTVASPPSQLRQESLSKHTIYSSMQHDMMNDFHILNCFFFPLKKVHIFLPRRESNTILFFAWLKTIHQMLLYWEQNCEREFTELPFVQHCVWGRDHQCSMK